MQSYNKAAQIVLPGDGSGLLLKHDFMTFILQKIIKYMHLDLLILRRVSGPQAKFTEDFAL